jgi:hypothetical protein
LHSEFLGTPLPDNAIYWAGLLISMIGGLATLLFAVEKFLEMFKAGTAVFPRYGGMLLPVAWAAWSFLLLYWKWETETVLVVLLGTTAIGAVALTLYRRCQAQ